MPLVCYLTAVHDIPLLQEATKNTSGADLYVVVYNALGASKSSIVRLPVAVNGTFDVSRLGNDSDTPATIRSIPNHFFEPSSASPASNWVLPFDSGPLSPIGATVFRVKRSSSVKKNRKGSHEVGGLKSTVGEDNTFIVQDDDLSVNFDSGTGAMISISCCGTTLNISQDWGYYTSYDNKIDMPFDNSSRPSQVRKGNTWNIGRRKANSLSALTVFCLFD